MPCEGSEISIPSILEFVTITRNTNLLSKSRTYLKILISAVLLTSTSIASISISPAFAADGEMKIQITGLNIQQDPNSSNHIVSLSGEVKNTGTETIKNLNLVLSTGGKISSRETLNSFLTFDSNPKLKETNKTAKLKNLTVDEKNNWRMTFVLEEFIPSPSGVYELAVTAKTNKNLATDRVALVANGPSSSALVTSVFAVQLATLNTHLASGGTSATDNAELNRLSNLVTNNTDLPISWIVDPELRQWLKELSSTELADQAKTLLAQLDSISLNSTPSIYSQPDLARIITSNRTDDLTNLVVRTNEFSGTNKVVIAPSGGRTTTSAITKLGELGVRPILSNKFLTNKEYKSVTANSLVGEVPALVNDEGLVDCLVNTEKAEFNKANCLVSQLAVAPIDNAGPLLLVTPLNWSSDGNALRNIVLQLQSQTWLSILKLNQLLDTPLTNSIKMPSDFEVDPFSSQLIKAGDAISSSSTKISSMFSDSAYSDAFNLARLRGFSSLWPTGDLATEFLVANENLLTGYQELITIDASRNITVSNTSTQIPITIANNSDRDVSVIVQLVSPQPSRFSSSPSPVVTVPSGKRVTVPMDITLTGKGILNINASLFAPNGQAIGKAKLIQISSAEYQGFARTLVVVAFGVLVLLSISNIVRRKREVAQ